jgi:predicted lysophospholipase L1 biosynthesis ABC-type transport system permease subunit
MGEKPPAWAPWITIMPIIRGLILCFAAKLSAIGAMIATAAGDRAPTAVMTAVMANMTHGIRATLLPTILTAPRTSRSMVPLFWAIAKRYVTPTIVRNRPPGKLARMSVVDIPRTTEPSRKAPTNARAPMLSGSTVASRNITARMMMDRTGADIVVPPG